MAKYTVRFYKSDYASRQNAANFDRAMCYVEQHFNSSGGTDVNYALATVATNAPPVAEEWGRWYTAQVSAKFGIEDKGISVGGYMGKANDHLRHTGMPALLLEPCFISNTIGAQIALASKDALAQILAESIMQFFPQGGLVAFSVGHKFSPNPNDRGGVTSCGQFEGDLAEQVMLQAKDLLEAAAAGEDEVATEEPVQQEEAPQPVVYDPLAGLKINIAKTTSPTQMAKTLSSSDWLESRRWVEEQGICDGKRPHDPVTREEVWQMLYRALAKKE